MFKVLSCVLLLVLFTFNAYSSTIDTIDHKYGYDTHRFIHEVNSNIELTKKNCMAVTDKIYNKLQGRQCSDLYKIGIYDGLSLRHSLIKYNDKWGDPYLIFIYMVDNKLLLVDVPAGDSTLSLYFPTWAFYRVYSNDRKRWTTKYRK